MLLLVLSTQIFNFFKETASLSELFATYSTVWPVLLWIFFPHIWKEIPLLQLVSVVFHPFSVHFWKESGLDFSITTD